MTKQNKVKKGLNEKVKNKIRELADMGLPDDRIAEITGASRYYVQKESTKFWQEKMNKKEE